VELLELVELVVGLLVLVEAVEVPDEPVPDDDEEPPAPEFPPDAALAPDVALFGRGAPRLGAMSLLIRLKRARTRRLCSTASRPARAWSNCTCIATYKAAMSNTPIAADRRTSRRVKP
jgi:hypothetical protein